jgi:hypothetical protein
MTLARAALAAALTAVVVSPASAQERPTLSGTWSASGLAERWSIGDWGDACGPKPAPQGAPGGTVQIAERGSELSIVGAGRAFSTSECWEQMPGLSRTSHSASGGGRFWRTHCASAPNDPRQASVTTTIQATDSSISLTETGQYQFVIQETNCTASVTRARTFSLIRREGDAAPTASASVTPPASASAPPATTTAVAKAPPPEPKPTRCSGTSSEPARLEVRPSRKLLRAGDTFLFRAVVLDDAGCPVATRPTWSIAPGPLASRATVDATGALAIAADAPEGRLEAIASVAGKGVTIPVEVASAEHYAALLASSGLDEAGESAAPAIALIATGTVGGGPGVADDLARARKHTFVAIVGGLALALGLAGLALLRRGRAGARPSRGADTPTFDEADAEGAPPSSAAASEPAEEAPPPPRAPERAEPAPKRAEPARPRGKICPTCGERYPSEAGFCGKDGTVLVPLN